MDSFLLSHGLSHCHLYPNVSYVDDLLIVGSSQAFVVAMKVALHDMFSMRNLGLLHCFFMIVI